MTKLLNKLKLLPAYQLLFIVFIICVILFARYIFGEYVYVFTDVGSDTVNAYYPKLYFNSRLIQDSFSLYSFNIGIGAPVLNYYLFDPFCFFLYLLPKSMLSSGIVFSIIIKIFFVAWFSYKFFKELLPDASDRIHQIGAIAVSFSGFFILWGQHYSFSSIFAFLPMMLYGFELLLKGKNKWLYTVAVALASLSLYAFYQIVFFSAFYFIIRIFIYSGLGSFKNRVLFLFGKLMPLSFIGVALVAFITLPVFETLISSPRINTHTINVLNYLKLQPKEFLGNLYFRLFSNNLLGSAQNYFGFRNYYESPQVYSTLLVLLLIPQAFLIRKRELFPLIILLGLFIVILFMSPFLSVILNGMQFPLYRWGMLSTVAMVILGVIGLQSLTYSPSRLKLILLFVTATILILILFLGTLQMNDYSNYTGFLTIVIFLCVYCILFLLFRHKPSILYLSLVTVLLFEIVIEHYPTVNQRAALNKNFEENNELYFDLYKNTFNKLSKKDTSFYRITRKSYSRFLNDAQVQNYNGLTSYTSLNDPFYIRFLKKTNVPFMRPNVLNYIGQIDGRPILNDLLSVKYYVSNSCHGMRNLFYSDTLLNAYCYKRTSALPLGFTYSSYLLEDGVDNFNDELLLKTIVLNQQPQLDIEKYGDEKNGNSQSIANGKLTITENEQSRNTSKEKVSQELTMTGNEVEIDYTTSFINSSLNEGRHPKKLTVVAGNNDPQMLLSFPLTESDSATVLVSFTIKTDVNSFCQVFWRGSDGLFSEYNSRKYNYKRGEAIPVTLKISDGKLNQMRIDPGTKTAVYEISDLKISQSSYVDGYRSEVYSRLLEDTLVIAEFEPDHIIGKISVEKNKLLFLSIPYNKGWKMYCNGSRVEPLLANYGFMAFPLETGDYTIELRFFPYGMKVGFFISLLAILIVVAQCLLKKNRKSLT